ncbi:MAG TPA: glutamate--tRNA ligase [Gammaproteobacteria bacterium]|nr:glutamate--tRNA ligase [Gammaproteobacteria bacterium]
MSVRTRFAPSPTGYLHVGGARTALFSWLFARKHGGQFILRIEDTDRERSTEESVQAILDGMDWLGLDYDEGPFYQTQRFDRYREVIQQLLDTGHAYYCDCSKERLDALREKQMAAKEKPRYDGCCCDKGLCATEGTVVRFKNPREGDVIIDDLVKGRVVINNRELDDLIIERADGTPTYNLTVVVDDLDMKMTHIIRGDDHLNNTPRQINILKALGAELPVYAHVPMILGDDGKRLSKRHGAVSVMQYRENGFLPEALINYLVRLSWSHGDQEIFSREEMIELFDARDINSSPSAFNTEKLLWLNQHYIKNKDPQALAELLQEYIQKAGYSTENGPDLLDVLKVYQERCSTLVELAEEMKYLYQDFDEYNAKQAKKQFKEATLPILESLQQQFGELAEWRAPEIHHVVENTVKTFEVGFGKVGQPLRLAVTGHGKAPSVDVTLELLGKEKTLQRLQQAIDYIRKSMQ